MSARTSVSSEEGSYLADTQGEAKEAKKAPSSMQPEKARMEPKKFVKIARPGYRVMKQQQPLLFQIDYPEITDGIISRHRFMSAYEQKIEPLDRKWQYLLFVVEPYETTAFKVPSQELKKTEGKFRIHRTPQFSFKLEPKLIHHLRRICASRTRVGQPGFTASDGNGIGSTSYVCNKSIEVDGIYVFVCLFGVESHL